jgi:ribose 5-phosphate isomerase B
VTVALGADHRGRALKDSLRQYLARLGHRVRDFGTEGEASVDYPDFAHAVARAVAGRRAARGVLVCATGIGMAIAANRYRGVRAALVCDERLARLAREHNDANVLCLGADTVTPAQARRILKVWLETGFAGGRHRRRVRKLDRAGR